MISLRTRAVKAALWGVQYRARRRTVEEQIAAIHRLAVRPGRFAPPRRLDRSCLVGAQRVDGQLVYRLRPRHGTVVRRLIYFHGGGFVHEIGYGQWLFAELLATRLHAEVIVPIYPLAPTATAAGNDERMRRLYTQELTRGAPPSVVGDSAGGGMAVSVLLELAAAGLPAPPHCVLISPWLDLTVTDPRVRELAEQDVTLSPEMLLASARLWAGTLPLEDPRVSPLLGDLTTLRGTSFFVLTGTHDILNADARAFQKAAAKAGLELCFDEEEEQPHVYVAMPTPEAAHAINRIASFLGAEERAPRRGRRRGRSGRS